MKKMARRIFVFSVGINRYASEDIHNLSGCANDVRAFQEVLKAHLNIPDIHCKCLLDESATRENIIEGFRAHFAQLEAGDVAIFHYSGHGSWEWTTAEFQGPPFETPGNKNEMILSHDFAVDGVLGIADKELRYLISELQYPKEGKHRDIHFVGLMDCCFSGSMFRRVDNVGEQLEAQAVLQIRKSAPDDPSARPLSQYLEGQYQEMQLADGQIVLPKADYVLLSASSHGEPANEDENGGLFTQALIRVLTYKRQEGKYPTYASLHFLISSSIERETDYQQHPHLEYSGNINPFECFAMNGRLHQPLLPEMQLAEDKREGVVSLGALHGLELPGWQHADLPVYQQSDALIQVGTARLKEVRIEKSKVLFFPNECFDAAHKDGLLVGLHAKPLNITYTISAEGQQKAASIHRALLESMSEKGLEGFFQAHEEAAYSIVIHSHSIAIYHDAELVIALEAPFTAADFDYIVDVLHRIARWEQFRQLETPRNSEVDVENIVFTFSYQDYEGREKKYEVAPVGDDEEGLSEICIPYDSREENDGAVLYEIKVGHNQLSGHIELYFYLVHLDRKYRISQKIETLKPLLPLKHDGRNSYEYISENHNLGLGITDENRATTSDVFSLIVAAEPLTAPYLFEQQGLGDVFGRRLSAEERSTWSPKEETTYRGGEDLPALWAVKKLKVTLIKQ
jgi:hypothetical protein